MKKPLLLALVLNLCPFVEAPAQSQTASQTLSGGVQEAWVARHSEKGSSNEYARAMAVDPASGNVYVTGYTDSVGRPQDYLTVKYNAAGAKQWTARYNGPGNGNDYAVAIAVDSAGNVYVTGSSTGVVTGYDFATIKYNSAGTQEWVAIYNANWHDYAVALAIDPASGDVYVTGYGASFDYATVKYNSAGIQQWVQTLGRGGNGDDAPVALVVDGASNVYVTGTRGFNYYTIKYDSAGAKQWVATYDGNFDDYAAAFAVDASGNVYVTGKSSTTFYRDSPYYDYATVKYNSAGQTQWVARYNGPGNNRDDAKALGVDPAGNVYVTGFSYGSNTYYDYATIKYNSFGQEQWVARYNGPGNSNDGASALGIDAEANIYVTGYSWSGASNDYVTVKYDSAGAEKEVAIYNGPGNGDDQAVALAVDEKGDIYVTGSSVGSGTGYDFATIKYTDNLLVNAGPDKEICSGQPVTIGGSPTATSGKPSYTYKWTPAASLNNPTAPNPIATPAATTTYMVEVTDASAAKATDKIVVTVKPCGGVVVVVPAPNALNASKATNISVTFNTGMNPATLTNGTIKVNGSQSGLHTGNITYDSGTKKAIFDPANDFKLGEVVTVTLTTGIKSASGVALTNPYTWSFTIKSLSGASLFANAGGPVVNSPVSVITGDFDGDGDLDLAAANNGSDAVSILKNSGNGAFVQATVSVGDGPHFVVAGDFDSDGDLDLAIPNRGLGNVSILKNSGSGAFTQSATLAVENQPVAISAGDFDGDGDLDLAVANSSSSTVSILKNDGNGAFTSSSPVSGLSHPHSIAVGDFDGDRDFDLAVANWGSGNVAILKNDGSGAFALNASVVVGGNPISVAAGDFDGDGDLDLAAAKFYSNHLSILKNNGSGVFTPTIPPSGTMGNNPASVIAGDFDADGDLDLAAANSASNIVSILKNDGNAAFTPSPPVGVGNNPNSVAAGDFDGDGDLDLAVGNSSSHNLSILKNGLIAEAGLSAKICAGQSLRIGGDSTATNGTPPYTYKWTPTTGLDNPTAANPMATPAATTRYTVEVTDARAVKATDQIVVTVNPCVGVVAVLPAPNALNVTKMTNLSVTFNAGMDPATLANSTIKVNGSQSGLHKSSNITYDSGTKKMTFDPARDFKPGEVVNVTLTTGIQNTAGAALVSPYTWSFTIKTPNGTGMFANAGNPRVGNNPFSTSAGDFDGDGDLDLAVTNVSSNNLTILKNSGSGVFTQTIVGAGNGPRSAAMGDFNGDGDLDLAVTNSNSNNVSIFNNDGNGAFVSTPVVVGNNPLAVAAGDFDGDGDLDLAASSYNNVSILKNDGKGTFTLGSPVGVGSNLVSVTVADFDGDRDLDLAMANHNSNNVSVLKNNGNGVFTLSASIGVGSNPSSVAAGDFDGDGDVDLAATNWNSNNVSILKNNGNGAFTPTSVGVGSNPNSVTVGDFDADGDLDLAAANYYSNNLSILKNNGSGVFTSAPLGVGTNPNFVTAGDFDGDGDVDLAVTNQGLNNLSIMKNGLIAEAGPNKEICSGQSVALGGNPTAANGAPPYTFKWTPITGLNNPTAAKPMATPAATTEYSVQVTDSSGAKATGKVIITVKPNTPAACAQTEIYANDFEGNVGPEWSSKAVATSPNGRHFLGEFGNQKVSLTLKELPAHNVVTVQFDLYIIETWDGNNLQFGPDVWRLDVDGGPTLLNTTFSKSAPDDFPQAFPSSFPGNSFPAQTGAVEIDALGYNTIRQPWGDAVYNLSYTVNHASASIIINFSASGLQGMWDESWGLDNVRIVTSNNAARNPVVNAGPDKEICSGESVIIGGTPTGTGGAPPYKYKWTPTTGLNDAAISNPTAKPVATTEYTVEVTDAAGAKATDKVIVTAHGGADKIICFVQTATSVGGAPTAIAAGDFDGDGDVDLAATRRYSNNLAILQNDGRGNYSVASSPAVGSQPLSVTAGDFDGDRDLDLAVTHYVDGFISVLFNSGKGDFAARTDYSMGISWNDFVAAADLDRDGDLDLIVTGTNSGNVSIRKNNGNGIFQPKVDYHFTRDADDAAIADFDNDGDLDLAATALDAPGLTLFQNAGDGTFAKKSDITVGLHPVGIMAADLDADGLKDLAVANYEANTVSILRNNGGWAFTQTSISSGGSNPIAVMAVDLNADGHLDLAVTNENSNSVTILQNDGKGSFTQASSQRVGTRPRYFTAGDFDGDGDQDLAVANQNSNSVSILKNGSGHPLIAEAGPNQKICFDQTVIIGGNPTATGGASPYTYKWTPTTGLDNPAVANPKAKPAATTTYAVEVTDAKGRKATDQMTITVPAAGWSVAHIVDVDDVIFDINQGGTTGAAPRDNRGLALSPDEQYLYLSYNNPASRRLVRKIKLSESDPANNHASVVAQLDLGTGAPAKALATDDKGRVYLARPQKIWIYKPDLSAALLHSIDGFTNCEGVAVTRESGKLVVYATDRTTRLLKRFELTEGAGYAITASTKTGLDGDGEVRIIGAGSPCGLDIAGNGTAWIADVGKGKVYRINSAGSTVDSTAVRRAMDIAIDASRGEVYVSQDTLRAIKVLYLSTGKIKRTLTPPAADLKLDLNGETGSGALTGIDVASCQRVFVANENGRSILTGGDSPFSNVGDNNNIKAADTDPVLVVAGNVVAKEAEVASDQLSVTSDQSSVISYQLAQNYPNPFSANETFGNPSTMINFALPEAGKATVNIYNETGQLVRTLVDREMAAGRHELLWNGRNQSGKAVAAGVYFYRMTVTGKQGEAVFAKTNRMAMVK